MATFIRRGSSWQVRIRREGLPPQSGTFPTKSEAESWARSVEHKIDAGTFVSPREAERLTFREAAARYEREILPKKRGQVQDKYKLRLVVRALGDYSLAAITTQVLQRFRDHRLTEVSPQTVVHDLNMIRRVLYAAESEFHVPLPRGIPHVAHPQVRNNRERRLLPGEEDLLLRAASAKSRTNKEVTRLIVLAIETAGRQSELLSLDWRDIDLHARVAKLRGAGGRETKNDDRYRPIPLSSRAIAVLSETPKTARTGKVFSTSQNALQLSYSRLLASARREYERNVCAERLASAGFPEMQIGDELRNAFPLGGPTKYRKEPHQETRDILIELQDDPVLLNLTFHDLRHEGTSRLAERFQIHELMKITGHRSPTMLGRYYHPRAEDLAMRLD